MQKKSSANKLKLEFYENHKKNIVPKLDEIEQARKGTIKAIGIISAIFGVFALAIFFINPAIIGVAAIFVLIAVGISFVLKNNWEKSVNDLIMPIVALSMGNFKWKNKYNSKIDPRRIGLTPYYTDIDYKNIFTGKINDTSIDFLEVNCVHKKDDKNETPVFKGIIVNFILKKSSLCHTVVKDSTKTHTSPISKLKYAKFENIKNFEIFTDDAERAKELLTDELIDILRLMKKTFQASRFSMVVFNEAVSLAFQTSKELLAPVTLSKPAYENSEFYVIYDEIASITRLVEYFDPKEQKKESEE